MRDIKFRAWDGKKMRECEVGLDGYVHGYDEDDNPEMMGAMCGGRILNQIPLMQFTGLLDKNGKEIYEGDIVEYNILGGGKVKRVVSWDNIFGVWEVKNKHTEELLGEVVKENENFEVIGNIHENPELLEGGV